MASKLKLLQEQIGKQQATIEKKVSQILHLPIAFATDWSVKNLRPLNLMYVTGC